MRPFPSRSFRARLVAFVAVQTILAIHADPASAQTSSPAPVGLAWDAPEDCPDRAHVLGEIEHLLGRGTDGTSAGAHVDARAVVTRVGPDQWQLRLDTVSSGVWGSRVIDGRSCLEVADATALILALAIDPDAGRSDRSSAAPPASDGSSSSPPPPLGAAPSASSSSPRPVTRWEDLPTGPPIDPVFEPVPTRPAPRPRAWRLAVRNAVALDVGTFPAPATGLELAAGVLVPRWRFEVNSTYWFPQFTAFSRAPLYSNEGADLSLFEVGTRVCFSPVDQRVFDLGACARVDIGSMTGAGRGIPFPATGSALWAAAMLGLSLGVSPSRWVSFRAFVDSGATLLAPTFEAGAFGRLHQPSPWLFRGQVGLECHF